METGIVSGVRLVSTEVEDVGWHTQQRHDKHEEGDVLQKLEIDGDANSIRGKFGFSGRETTTRPTCF